MTRLALILVGLGLGLTGQGRVALGQDYSGLVGRQVVEISRDLSLQQNGRVVADGTVHRMYKVSQVNGGWVYLTSTGVEGWAPANQVVTLEQAIPYFSRAIEANPNHAYGYVSRALVENDMGYYVQGLTDLYIATCLDRTAIYAANNLAWVLATCPNDEMRRGKEAVSHAMEVNARTGYRDAAQLDTLAAAFAESKDFAKAIYYQRSAIAASPSDGDMRDRLKLYERNEPCRYGVKGVIDEADKLEIEQYFRKFGLTAFEPDTKIKLDQSDLKMLQDLVPRQNKARLARQTSTTR